MKIRLLVFTCLLSVAFAQAQQTVNPVRINQEGYYTQGPKVAAVVGET
jgi:hypothetical protein